MPKVYLSEEDRWNAELERYIVGEMSQQKISQDSMASYLGLPQQTFSYQLRHHVISFANLKKIFRKLQTDDKEILRLMRG